MTIGAAKERIDELVAHHIPGASRVLTKEEISAEYGSRATRPIPPGYKRQSVNNRIESTRLKPFVVYRVHTTGKCDFMSSHATFYDADIEAGRLRDAMTDAECALDYSYEAKERKRGIRR